MEHDKELELEILNRITKSGKIYYEDFVKLFGNDWLEYQVVFKRIISTANINYITEMNLKGTGRDGYYYQLNEYGELRRKILQKEKYEEIERGNASKEEGKQGTIRTNWTVASGWMILFTFILTLLILHFTCYPYHPEKLQQEVKVPGKK